MQEATKSEPSLTEGAIVGHMVRLAIPASTGMIFNTLYNLTDIWFAGYLSDNALAGLSIASSVFFLLLSIGIGIGIQTGASAMIAPGAGRGETHEVKGWLDNVSGLAIAFSAVSCVIGFLRRVRWWFYLALNLISSRLPWNIYG